MTRHLPPPISPGDEYLALILGAIERQTEVLAEIRDRLPKPTEVVHNQVEIREPEPKRDTEPKPVKVAEPEPAKPASRAPAKKATARKTTARG